MKAALAALVSITLVTGANAKIGDAPEAYVKLYGPALKESIDNQGYGLRVYRSEKFREIRVTFVQGKSQLEDYKVSESEPVPDSIRQEIERENPGQFVNGSRGGVKVGSGEPESELKFVNHSGEQHSYSGTLEIKREGEYSVHFIREGESVVEMVFGNRDPSIDALKAGTKCTVVVLDEHSDNLETLNTIVSRRSHVDWDDAIEDAHSSFQQLVRISTGDKLLIDRSICGLHHLNMELRQVPIGYGMGGFSRKDIECMNRFPHSKESISGGCVMSDDSPRFGPLYICPKCVAECNEYMRKHASDGKPD